MSVKRRKVAALELTEHPDIAKLAWVVLHPAVSDVRGLRDYARAVGSGGLTVSYVRSGSAVPTHHGSRGEPVARGEGHATPTSTWTLSYLTSDAYKDRHPDKVHPDGSVKIHNGVRLSMVLQKRETDEVLKAIAELQSRGVRISLTGSSYSQSTEPPSKRG